MHELKEVQEYLENILPADRVEECYNLISNPQNRVKTEDEKWVAYVSQASENITVVNAMKKILAENGHVWQLVKDDVTDAIDIAGLIFVNNDVVKKPRIPFYVLVLDQVI